MIVASLSVAVVLLAVIAQRERMKRELFAAAVVDAHKWIDEIITALRDPDEDQGNRAVDRLAAQFSDDGRVGGDQPKVLRGGPEGRGDLRCDGCNRDGMHPDERRRGQLGKVMGKIADGLAVTLIFVGGLIIGFVLTLPFWY